MRRFNYSHFTLAKLSAALFRPFSGEFVLVGITLQIISTSSLQTHLGYRVSESLNASFFHPFFFFFLVSFSSYLFSFNTLCAKELDTPALVPALELSWREVWFYNQNCSVWEVSPPENVEKVGIKADLIWRCIGTWWVLLVPLASYGQLPCDLHDAQLNNLWCGVLTTQKGLITLHEGCFSSSVKHYTIPYSTLLLFCNVNKQQQQKREKDGGKK